MDGILVLEDGTLLRGRGFGSPGIRIGEVVFTTSMTGYPESLTDPSYRGQILILSHPLIGNYGVPDYNSSICGIPLHFESDRIQVEGLVISRLMRHNHWASKMSLDEWLKVEGVPGIEGIDTRFLIKKIRDRGVMRGAMIVGVDTTNLDTVMERLEKYSYDEINHVKDVSTRNITVYEPEKYSYKVVLHDLGVKYGIIRELLWNGFMVIRVPWYIDPIEVYEDYNADGIIISNGPGNPVLLRRQIDYCKHILGYGAPTLGICLGHQLLSLADGSGIFKLKYGHRGANKPVKDLLSSRGYVTTQNHGYAVDIDTLNNFRLWMVNIDDGTVEGLIHEYKPVITTQFHPEASPGPRDTGWVFREFIKLIEGRNIDA